MRSVDPELASYFRRHWYSMWALAQAMCLATILMAIFGIPLMAILMAFASYHMLSDTYKIRRENAWAWQVNPENPS